MGQYIKKPPTLERLANFILALATMLEVFVLQNGFNTFFLKLSGIQAVVVTFSLDQIVMFTGFDDLTIFNNQDHVSLTNGGKTVSDHEGGTALHQTLDGVLDQTLSHGVDGGSCLI